VSSARYSAFENFFLPIAISVRTLSRVNVSLNFSLGLDETIRISIAVSWIIDSTSLDFARVSNRQEKRIRTNVSRCDPMIATDPLQKFLQFSGSRSEVTEELVQRETEARICRNKYSIRFLRMLLRFDGSTDYEHADLRSEPVRICRLCQLRLGSR